MSRAAPKRLLYFTDSYPFGLGEEWKRRELEAFRRQFEKVTVIPLHFGGNRTPKPPVDGVEYHEPIFPDGIPGCRRGHRLARIVLHGQRSVFLRELRRQVTGLSAARFGRWLEASDVTMHLGASGALKQLLSHAEAETVLYFFWARGISQVLPLVETSRFRRVALRLHGYDLYDSASVGLPYQLSQLEKASDIITCSNAGAEHLLRKFPKISPKLYTAILGTDFVGRSPMSNDGIIRLVSCAFVRPVKRMHLIVEALRHVRARIQWIHIGDGPDLLALRRLADSRLGGTLVQTQFLGRLEPAAVPRYYTENPVDFFLNVSISEGIPVSIMEAFAAGVPAIATAVGGTPELVDGSTGCLLPADCSVQAVAQAIERLGSEDFAARRNRRDAAHAKFRNSFDASVNAAHLAERLAR